MRLKTILVATTWTPFFLTFRSHIMDSHIPVTVVQEKHKCLTFLYKVYGTVQKIFVSLSLNGVFHGLVHAQSIYIEPILKKQKQIEKLNILLGILLSI